MRPLLLSLILPCIIHEALLPGLSASEVHPLASMYGYVRTIAGMGEEEDGNFWQPSFEGADARTVELSNPHMTMADARGNYYIADKESHSILRVDPSGMLTTFAGTHEAGYNGEEGEATAIQLDNPNGLHVHPNGNVYILDFLNQRVRKVDPDGWLTTLFRDPDGFGPGRALWVSADEHVIYVNGPSQVKRWTPETGMEVVVSNLADPGNLTIDPNGDLVVTSRGSHQVFRITPDGERVVIAGNGTAGEPTTDGALATEVGLESVRGIAFLPDGSYFLAMQKGGGVWYVDVSGRIHRFLQGRRSGNTRAGDGEWFHAAGDKISEPRAVTIAPNGDVIITTNDRGFVRVVEHYQTPEVLATADGHWHIRLTPGREHHLEASGDLRTWISTRFLERDATEITIPILEQNSAFIRVAWK